MIENARILVTGATGQVAFPIAAWLARSNDVWGAATLRDEAAADRLANAGIEPVAMDLDAGDVDGLPKTSTMCCISHSRAEVPMHSTARCG